MQENHKQWLRYVASGLYVIFMALNFFWSSIGGHIWWFFGISFYVFILGPTFRYMEMSDTEKQLLKAWFAKNKPILLYLVSSVLVLLIFRSKFWIVSLTLALIWIAFIAIDKLIRKFFGCRVCNATGRLSGYNPHLNIEFDNDVCYCCNGKQLVYKEKSDWYKIALKIRKEIIELKHNLTQLEKEHALYSSEAKIGKNVNVEKVLNRDTLLNKKFEENKESYKDKIQLHEEIEKRAHIFLHVFYVAEQQEKWVERIKVWNSKNLDAHESALILSGEAEIALKFSSVIESLENLLELEINSNVAEELRLDIEQATRKLKLLLLERT